MFKSLFIIEEEPTDEEIFTKPSRIRMATKEEVLEGLKEMLQDENILETLKSMEDYYEE
jgi:GTP cyclohydrolase I